MYYKFLFPLVLFLCLLPVNAATSSDPSPAQSKATIVSQKKDEPNPAPGSFISIELPQDVSNGGHPEDDGKTHYFHFNRLDRNQRRALYCFAAKIILLFAHLCFLIAAYLHFGS